MIDDNYFKVCNIIVVLNVHIYLKGIGLSGQYKVQKSNPIVYFTNTHPNNVSMSMLYVIQ